MLEAPSTTWIHPKVVIKLFANLVARSIEDLSEFNELVKQRDLKITVEAWCAAMYLVALMKLLGHETIFMQANPDDPPDFYGLHLFEKEGRVLGYEMEIEVFQVAPESISPLEEIRKKVAKKYSVKTVLVCLVRKPDFINTLGSLHELVSSLSPKHQVWVIGGDDLTDASEHVVARIFPGLQQVGIDVAEIVGEKVEYSFVEATKGISRRLNFQFLGQKRLDPRFTVHDFE